jgi:hypothetical protein
MTGRLEEALRRVESLSQEEQDAIVSQIMETLDDEDAWARSFRERPAVLRSPTRELSDGKVSGKVVFAGFGITAGAAL